MEAYLTSKNPTFRTYLTDDINESNLARELTERIIDYISLYLHQTAQSIHNTTLNIPTELKNLNELFEVSLFI